MKIKEKLLPKTVEEAQASPTPQGKDRTVSNPKSINAILEGANFLDIAMLYAQMNIKVFPIKKKGKNPLCKGGFKSASDDLVVLREWNRQFPDCNIGIPTGTVNHIFVVDVDGDIGMESLDRWEQQHGKLEAPTVLTGKGKHLYFKMPDDMDIGSSVSKVADHIDIRANGACVVAPPSIHENGSIYTWQHFEFHQSFPEAPAWLMSLITESKRHSLIERNELSLIMNAPEGTRNDTLFKVSCDLIKEYEQRNLPMIDLKDNVVHAAIKSGLSADEAEKTFDNALRFLDKNTPYLRDNEPDMDILKTKILLPPPVLDTTLFKNLEDWIVKTAQNTNAPVDYVAFSLLLGAAGIIGASRTISPRETWIEPCCLWVGAVGEPSSGKTPATTPIRRILHQIEDARKKPYRAKMAQWKTQQEVKNQKTREWKERIKENPDNAPPYPTNMDGIPHPQPPQFVYGDTTQEAIVRDMEYNQKGAIIFRDELSAWITGMNRYNSGSSERGFWLEAFNGNRFTIDRVKYGQERVEIKSLLISVFGTIQPQKLSETLLHDGADGFLSRFLWVYPEPTAPCIPQNIALPDTALKAFEKLETLLNPYADDVVSQKKCLSLSDEAQACFYAWYIPHLNRAQKEESLLKHFLGKGQGYVLRLALLLELLWWASSAYDEPTQISAEAIQSAVALYDRYLVPMCERVYNMYYSPQQNIEARTLARFILENKLQSFTLHDIYYSGRIAQLRRKEQAQKAADVLIKLNWLSVTTSRAGTTAGRKRKTYYVNSEVYALANNM